MASIEYELRSIVTRGAEGHMSFSGMITGAAALGCLSIGTAVSSEGYMPTMQITNYQGLEPVAELWRPMFGGQDDGGSQLLVRASADPRTTALLVAAGDINKPGQRFSLDAPVSHRGRFYNLGTVGWDPNDGTRPYDMRMHSDIATQILGVPPDTQVGAVDFMRVKNVLYRVPGEARHYAVPLPQERIASCPVYARTLHALLRTTRVYHYSPIEP